MTGHLRGRFLGWAVLVALLAVAATTVEPGAASAEAFPEIGTIWASAVSDDDQVVHAGSWGLAIDGPDGTRLAVLETVKDHEVIDIRDGDAYVGDSFSSDIVVVDLATRQVEATIDVGFQLRGQRSLVVLADSIWFVELTGKIYRYDRATGVSSQISSVTTTSSSIARFPGDDSRVMLTEAVFGGGKLSRVQTSPPHSVHTVTGVVGNHDLAPTDHGTFWAINLTAAEEIDANWMLRLGVLIPSGGDTVASYVDWSPLAGGSVAWATSQDAYVAPVDSSVPSHHFARNCGSFDVYLGRALPVLHAGCDRPFDLRPQLNRWSTTSAVAGVPTGLTITGNGFGGDVGVTIDGVPLTPVSNTPTELRLDLPTTLAPGAHTVAVTNAWGTRSRAITALPNLGANLGGDVRRGTAPVAGAQLTLTGATLGAPLVTTSDAEGRYGFSGLPFGEYRLTVTDPTGVEPAQVVSQVDLVPNEQTELDISFRDRLTGGSTVARTQLPDGTIRTPTVAPDGRVLIPVGDELVISDVDGAVIGRVRRLPGVSCVRFGGDGWYATLSTSEVVRLDIDALQTVGRWPLGAAVFEPVVPAAGRAWFVARAASTSQIELRSLDPTTGVVTSHGMVATGSQLRPVEGDTDLLVRSTVSPSVTDIYDVSSGAPVLERSTNESFGAHTFDAVGGRIVSRGGTEFRFADFGSTGVTYPLAGWSVPSSWLPHVSHARGGLLMMGTNIVRVGAPELTHQLPGTAPTQYGLHDPSGDHVFSIVGSALVITSLAPTLAAPTGTVAPGVATISVSGFGLGAATHAHVDGQPVVIVGRTATRVDLWVPSFAAGNHTVDVTTPWGTSDPVTVTAAYTGPPVASTVSPSEIPTAGGAVTITGSGFTGATQVRVGGSVPATSFTVVDDRTITATFGPRIPSTLTVTVTTPRGTSSSAGPSLRWVAPPPVITEVTPNAGAPQSQAVVTVRGSGFSFASSVRVGGAPATYSPLTDTEMTVTLPSGTPGIAHVTVTTPGGTSAPSAASAYTWDAALPHIGSLSETSGPLAGGRLVVLRGSALAAVTEVWFGDILAEHVVVDDATVVAVTPPRVAAGAVGVRVVSPAGSSASTVDARYAYIAQGTGTISGVVRSSSGPLAQMAVVLSGARDFGVLTYALTDDDGRFQIPDVGSGEYRILTLDPRILFGAPDHHIGEFYDDGGSTLDDFAASTPVVVSAGATTVLDPIVLRHNTPASVSGVVRDAAGHGLGGLEVIVSPAGELDVSTSVLTEADGSFAVGGLAPGAYRVVTIDPAELRGDEQHYVAEVYDDAGGLDAFSSSAVVEVAVGASVTLSPIVLDHSAPGAVTGVVHGPGGAPLAGIVAVVLSSDGSVSLGTAATAADGTFTVPGITPGPDHRVRFFDGRVLFGLPAVYREELFDDALDLASATPVAVAAGATTTLPTVELALLTP